MSLPRVQLTVRTMMLLTLATALVGWLYLQTLRQEVGPYLVGTKAYRPHDPLAGHRAFEAGGTPASP